MIKIQIMTDMPRAFFIITLPATTKSKLSFIKPPISGTELETAYLAALTEIPS